MLGFGSHELVIKDTLYEKKKKIYCMKRNRPPMQSNIWTVDGTVAPWLVRSTLEQMFRVQALAGDIVLCSWARHFILTVPLSTQEYKWVLANLMLGVTLRWTSIPSRGECTVEILLVASCHRNWDKLRPDGPLGSHADFTFLTVYCMPIRHLT